MTAAEIPGPAMVPDERSGQGGRSLHETAGPGPAVIEGPGRYKVWESPDGGWVIARALDICQTCRECGCGEQAEAIQVPGMVVRLAMQQGKGKLLSALKMASGRR